MAISFLPLFFFSKSFDLPNHSAFLESPVPSNGSSFIKDSFKSKTKGSQRRTLFQQHTAYHCRFFSFYTNGSNIYIRFFSAAF